MEDRLDRLICGYCDERKTESCEGKIKCRKYQFQRVLYEKFTREQMTSLERSKLENR